MTYLCWDHGRELAPLSRFETAAAQELLFFMLLANDRTHLRSI